MLLWSMRIAVEQGSVLGWNRYAGAAGRIIGTETFGASAPLKEHQHKFAYEPERVVGGGYGGTRTRLVLGATVSS
jgi:transketolase